MKISQAFPSEYLKAADLDDQEITLRITAVKMGKVSDDGKMKPILYFEDQKQGLALNKTNATVIKKSYGEETDEWIGKDIVLYPATVEFKGDMVEAIRVRIIKPRTATRQEFKRASEPEYDEEGYPIK